MIVLDTNVLSEVMRPAPDRSVLTWLDAQDALSVATSAITVAEILYGIERMPHGRRRRELAATVAAMFEEDFAGRIPPFDALAAVHYAEQASASERVGRAVHTADAQIAAICRQHQASLATRNVRDFQSLGIELINPWESH